MDYEMSFLRTLMIAMSIGFLGGYLGTAAMMTPPGAAPLEIAGLDW